MGAEMIASVCVTKNNDLFEATRHSQFILNAARRSCFEKLLGRQLMSEEVWVHGGTALAAMEPTDTLHPLHFQ